MLQCLGEHSHANNDFKRMLGLYFYAVGTGRQPFTILNHLGITESYSNLTAKGVLSMKSATSSPTLLVGIGTLHKLSATARDEAREVAQTGLYVTVYDNINFMSRTPEQIIGRSGKRRYLTSLCKQGLTISRYTAEWHLRHNLAASWRQ